MAEPRERFPRYHTFQENVLVYEVKNPASIRVKLFNWLRHPRRDHFIDSSWESTSLPDDATVIVYLPGVLLETGSLLGFGRPDSDHDYYWCWLDGRFDEFIEQMQNEAANAVRGQYNRAHIAARNLPFKLIASIVHGAPFHITAFKQARAWYRSFDFKNEQARPNNPSSQAGGDVPMRTALGPLLGSDSSGNGTAQVSEDESQADTTGGATACTSHNNYMKSIGSADHEKGPAKRANRTISLDSDTMTDFTNSAAIAGARTGLAIPQIDRRIFSHVQISVPAEKTAQPEKQQMSNIPRSTSTETLVPSTTNTQPVKSPEHVSTLPTDHPLLLEILGSLRETSRLQSRPSFRITKRLARTQWAPNKRPKPLLFTREGRPFRSPSWSPITPPYSPLTPRGKGNADLSDVSPLTLDPEDHVFTKEAREGTGKERDSASHISSDSGIDVHGQWWYPFP